MKKNEIDKLFAEKLREHKTPPAGKVWETLAEELGETPGRKVGVWWKIAATVLLCLAAGLWTYRANKVDEKIIAVQEEQPSVGEPSTQSMEPVEMGKDTTEEMPTLSIPPENNKPTQLAEQQVIPSVKEQEKRNMPQTQISKAEPPVRSVEPLKTLATLDVEEEAPAVEDNNFPEEIAVAKVGAEVRAPVTIIYKADAPKNQEEEKDNKFIEIVKEIKNGDLGLAELRDAKSELLASAFSRLKDMREKQ